MKTNKSIKKNYFYNVIAKLVLLLIPIVVTPFLARKLEPDGNGVLSYIASIVSYFILAANIGIETYGQRVIATHQENLPYQKKFFYEISILRIILTIFSLIVYYIIFVFVLEVNAVIYAIYGITLLCTIFDFTWFFQGVENFKVIALSNVVVKMLYIPLVIILVNTKDDLWLACLLTVLSTVLPYFITLPILIKYLKNTKIESKINPFIHFKPCMVYFVPTIAIQIYTVLDKTMIGIITQSDFENGYYEQAEKLVKLPLTILTGLNVIMRSRISSYYVQNEYGKIKTLINKSAHFTFCFSIPITFGFCAVARTLVPLYLGEGYDKCVTLVYVLSPIIIIIGISNLIGTHYYTPFDKQKISNIILIIGAIVNVVLNSFLIYFYQSIGAAIASVVAEFVISILYIFFARKFISPVKFFIISIKYIISGILMFILVFFLNSHLGDSPLWLLLEVPVGIIAYFIMLLILKDSFVLHYARIILTRLHIIKKEEDVK